MSQEIVGQYDFEDGTFQGLNTFAEVNGSVGIVSGNAHSGVYSAYFARLVRGGMAIASVHLGRQDNFVWDGWFKINTLPLLIYEKIRVMRVYDLRGEVDGALFDIMAMRISDGSTRLYAMNIVPGTNVNLGVNATADTWVHLTITVNQGQVQMVVNGVATSFSLYWGGDNYWKLHIGCLWSDLAHESYFDDIIVTIFSDQPPPVKRLLTLNSNIPVQVTVDGALYASGSILEIDDGEVVTVGFPASIQYGGLSYLFDRVMVNGDTIMSQTFQVLMDRDMVLSATYVEEYIPPPLVSLTLNCNISVQVEVNGLLYPTGSSVQFERGTLVTVTFPSSVVVGGITFLLSEVLVNGIPEGTGTFQGEFFQDGSIEAIFTPSEEPPPGAPVPLAAILLVGGAVLYLLLTRK